MWDITYLNGPHKGMFYYLYLFSDLYDRSIVGWEVYEEESADYASSLIKRICLKQGRLTTEPLVLHSDNGWLTHERRYNVGDPVSDWYNSFKQQTTCKQ